MFEFGEIGRSTAHAVVSSLIDTHLSARVSPFYETLIGWLAPTAARGPGHSAGLAPDTDSGRKSNVCIRCPDSDHNSRFTPGGSSDARPYDDGPACAGGDIRPLEPALGGSGNQNPDSSCGGCSPIGDSHPVGDPPVTLPGLPALQGYPGEPGSPFDATAGVIEHCC